MLTAVKIKRRRPRQNYAQDDHRPFGKSRDGGWRSCDRQLQRTFLLNIVIGERAAVIQFAPGEHEPHVHRIYAGLILDQNFHIFDGIARFHIKGERAAPGRDKNCMAAAGETAARVKQKLSNKTLNDFKVRYSVNKRWR